MQSQRCGRSRSRSPRPSPRQVPRTAMGEEGGKGRGMEGGKEEKEDGMERVKLKKKFQEGVVKRARKQEGGRPGNRSSRGWPGNRRGPKRSPSNCYLF